jgi:meiotically up-regulated gene 157 (Mug157) protein
LLPVQGPVSAYRLGSTLGFNGSANLDDGTMWPAALALKELTAADEARIRALVKRAVS